MINTQIIDPIVAEQVNELRADRYALAAEIEQAHHELDRLGILRRDLFMVPFSLPGRIALLNVEIETRKLAAQEIKVDALIAHASLAVLERHCRELTLEFVALRAPERLRRLVHHLAKFIVRIASGTSPDCPRRSK